MLEEIREMVENDTGLADPCNCQTQMDRTIHHALYSVYWAEQERVWKEKYGLESVAHLTAFALSHAEMAYREERFDKMMKETYGQDYDSWIKAKVA